LFRYLFYLLVGLSYVLSTASAQKMEPFVPANDVSLTISSQRRSYKAGEKITLRYRITNVSNAPLYAPREWESKCPSNPHLWGWFENSSGKHFVPGYAGSCFPSTNPKTLSDRLSKEAILLRPGEHSDGELLLDTTLFGGLAPGWYRIEAVMYGWAEEKFTEAERSELVRVPHPLLRGEIPVSMRLKLTR
jgi:hypothetical protein